MAGSSRTCTDEELEKAMADLDELYAQIPDECKFYCTETEDYVKKIEERKERDKKKKKKLYILPPYQVQMILNYKGRPLEEHKGLEMLEKIDKEKVKDLRHLFNVFDTFDRHRNDFIRSSQDKVRHQHQTKGYVTYEGTDDEEDEDAAVHNGTLTMRWNQRLEFLEDKDDMVHHGARGAGGRRRHRPGVTMSAKGVVKKLN